MPKYKRKTFYSDFPEKYDVPLKFTLLYFPTEGYYKLFVTERIKGTFINQFDPYSSPVHISIYTDFSTYRYVRILLFEYWKLLTDEEKNKLFNMTFLSQNDFIYHLTGGPKGGGGLIKLAVDRYHSIQQQNYLKAVSEYRAQQKQGNLQIKTKLNCNSTGNNEFGNGFGGIVTISAINSFSSENGGFDATCGDSAGGDGGGF